MFGYSVATLDIRKNQNILEFRSATSMKGAHFVETFRQSRRRLWQGLIVSQYPCEYISDTTEVNRDDRPALKYLLPKRVGEEPRLMECSRTLLSNSALVAERGHCCSVPR